jgi:hypothetical protein
MLSTSFLRAVNLKDGARIFCIFLAAIYSILPFETANVTATLVVRCMFAFVLLVLVFDRRIRIEGMFLICFLILVTEIILAALTSFSFRLFASIIAAVLGFVWGATMLRALDKRRLCSLAVLALIYFSAGSLFLQLLVYHLGGGIAPLHEIVFPMSTARTEDHDLFARLGGIYIEPGTYANWVYALYVLLVLSSGGVYLIPGLIVGLTLMLTASIWGIAVGVLVAAVAVLSSKKIGPIRKVVLILIVILLQTYYLSGEILDFVQQKLQFGTPSGESKLVAFDEFADIWVDVLFLGNGFDPQFCVGCLAPQDAGLFLNMSVVYGIGFAVILFFVIFVAAYKTGGVLLAILLLPLLFAKLNYWDFIFWMIACTAMAQLQTPWRLNPNRLPQVMRVKTYT